MGFRGRFQGPTLTPSSPDSVYQIFGSGITFDLPTLQRFGRLFFKQTPKKRTQVY